MQLARLAFAGVFSTLLLGDLSHHRVSRAQGKQPTRLQDVKGPAQTVRPLHIEGSDPSIVKATIRGPEFAASSLFVGVEDPTSPIAKRLREEYRLDDLIAGETSEFRKMLKLRHWVHSRWHIDNEQNFNGDVFAILERAKAGDGFNCTHAMKVQHAAMTAMGYVVRDLGVQSNTEKYPDAFHHGVNEVWSNEFSKWVLMDGEYDFHFERDGQPLSALDVHESVRANGGHGIVKVQGPDRMVVPMQGPGFPFTSAIGYWWTAYHVRQNTFTQPSGNESRLVIFDNGASRTTTWLRKRGDNVLRKHWAYDAKAFVPTTDRRQIEWTPGVPDLRIRRTGPAELEVRVTSVTPNLKATSVRINSGDWRTLNDGRLAWKLQRGDNQLEVRTRNVLDVDGPIVMVAVTLMPRADAAGTEPSALAIGQGGSDGFVAVGPDGQIHVVFGGKYRFGRSPAQLSPEESIAGTEPVHTVRIAVDVAGQPHIVFTTGVTDNAKRSYYTARIGGRWLPAEIFADAADYPERTRAYVADVAVDSDQNVLVSYWVSRPREKRPEYDNPSFYYRWRSADGRWGDPLSLPAHWSSAPKVEFEPGRGFFLLWQFRGNQWRIAGKTLAGERFTQEKSISTGSETLTGVSTIQNEGADFTRAAGRFVVAGNVREKFEGPVGVWAAIGADDAPLSATYLGSFPGTQRGDESGIHPVAAIDAATGDVYVTMMNPGDKRACYAVHRDGKWQLPYLPLLPDRPAPHGTLRQGPSVADVPGPGVVALVRDGQQQWHLCTLTPPKGADAPPGKDDEKPVAWNALGETQTLGPGITPGICVDASGSIHVVYMGGGQIFYRQADAQARFSPAEELPLPEGAANYNSPHLVCDSQGTVHLTFQRDFTRASKKCWYLNRRGGKWSPPLLVLDRSGSEGRVNYPRLAIRGNQAIVGGFIGGGSAIARLMDIYTQPKLAGSVESPLWVAHPLVDPAGQLWVVGRDGARGHKLERYSDDLRPAGEPLLLSSGTPTKTFEPTAAIVDPSGVIHAAGATQSPVQVIWYSTNVRAAAGKRVILGPELGHDIREDAYPVLCCDARGKIYLSYRHLETGEARLTVLDESTETFVPQITVAPAVEKRLRWNPHLAAAKGGGVYVVWDAGGQVYFRPVGVTPFSAPSANR